MTSMMLACAPFWVDCKNLEPLAPTCRDAAWILLDHLSRIGSMLGCVLDAQSVLGFPS